MAFWSSERFKVEHAENSVVFPFSEGRLRHGAYELGLGPEVYITSHPSRTKVAVPAGGQINIPPGQFAVLLSEEKVNIPLHAIGFISIKAGIKFKGLVNISGFHVDPGFSGRLKFSVYNAGGKEMTFQRRQRVFLVWFADLDQPTADRYQGQYQNQDGITAEDVMDIKGEVSSPAELDVRLKDVERKLATYRQVVISLFAGGILLILSALLGFSPFYSRFKRDASKMSNSEQVVTDSTSENQK